MALQSNSTFSDEGFPNISTLISDQDSLFVRIRFRKTQTESDEKNWWTSTKPKERTPSVRSGIDETSRKRSREKIAEGIALLQHTRDQTTSLLWTIFERCSSSVSVKTTHRNPEQRSAGEKLWVCLTKSSAEFKDDEEKIVDDERPFSSVPIGSKTEYD